MTPEQIQALDWQKGAGLLPAVVQHARHAAHPCAIHRAAFRARGDVVEHELIRALLAIALRQLEDVAHDHVVAEAHALDDLPVFYIEAGDDAFGKNGRNS